MLSFGVAPSITLYSFSLSKYGKLGWLAAFVYTACAALRLARFNTQIGQADKRYFQGLPSPCAAAILASVVWVAQRYHLPVRHFHVACASLAIGVGLLMVSNFRYHSFKMINLGGRVSFMAIILAVAVYIGIALDPPTFLFTVFMIYGLSGPS